MEDMILLFFFVLRLVTSLGVAVLAARQRMWLCMVVGLALLVGEPWAVLVALGGDSSASHGPVVYSVLAGLAVLGWVAGRRFRGRHGDSAARREVSELPLLHALLVAVEVIVALAL
jgi:hypothetical protein